MITLESSQASVSYVSLQLSIGNTSEVALKVLTYFMAETFQSVDANVPD